MKAEDYSIFRVLTQPGYALIDDNPPRMLRPMDLREGLSVKKSWPNNATCALSTRHKGKKLADFFGNIMGHLIVSDKAKAVLEAEKSLSWEWYAIAIVDAKRKPISAKYTWAHLLGNVECVDRAKSEYTPSSVEPTQVHTFERLVLDPKRVPKEPSLFRLKEQPGTKIIRSDLVQRLHDAQVSGFEVWELDSAVFL